jgi:hypothetical protein
MLKTTKTALYVVAIAIGAAIVYHYISAEPSTKLGKPARSAAASAEDTQSQSEKLVSGNATTPKLSAFSQLVNTDGDLPMAIRGMLASKDPDDWYRATAINLLCARAVGSLSGAEPGLFFRIVASELDKLKEATRNRCGFMSDLTQSVNTFNGMLPRAREAGSVLAAAPRLTQAEVKAGLQPAEWSALQRAVMTPDGAETWLAANNADTFVLAVSGVSEFQGYKLDELSSAIFLGICAGNQCADQSLYRLQLCIQSLGKVCDSRGISEGAATAFGESRARQLKDTGERLIYLLRQGELERLGIRKRVG